MQKLRVKVIYPLATQAHFPAAVKYRDQLSLKNARDRRCITANVLQTTNVDAQCDKLATELS